MKYVFFIVAILCFSASCKKTAPVINNSIIGKWRLAAALSDPGDVSGKWIPTNPYNPKYLQFNPDGTLTNIPAAAYDWDHYRITSDTTIIFYRGTLSFNMEYEFAPSLLTINPLCIEPCGLKYVPAN
ncbi:MAG: hypothetical protein ACHQET_09400 [Chitinophagales bacterium]